MTATDDNIDQHGSGDMNGGDMTSSKKECTSCEQNNVENIAEGIDGIAIHDDMSTCANCGKEGDDIKNICNKCKQVKYCNAVCKKKHRHKHKKDCEEHLRLAAEHAAELHDEKLFKQPPIPLELQGDCPICFIRLPSLNSGSTYYACCGKVICNGCDHAPVYDNQGNKVKKVCPFCRIPHPASDEEIFKREMKRVELNDPIAIFNRGNYYRDGTDGFTQDFPKDMDKALELWQQSGELGCAKAYTNIGCSFDIGRGVEVDKKKATHYYQLAAMKGDESARYNLGGMEQNAGNIDRALKHYMIAVGYGDRASLKRIKQLYSDGYATKEDYAKALQIYQAYLEEIKSVQRDKVAAACEDYRYY